MANSFAKTKEYIKCDIYRNLGSCTLKDICKAVWGRDSMVNLLVCYRLCHYWSCLSKRNLFQFVNHGIWYMKFKKLQIKCGIEMNQRTKIGYGLRLPHRGGIVIHPQAVIGNNCEIMQGVTIGNNILKSRDQVAVIGDQVLLCAGVKVIGEVHIGNTVVVGANAVVTKDIASHTIVAGSPAKEIGKCDDRFVINQYHIQNEEGEK